jgi:transposase InsO family protein
VAHDTRDAVVDFVRTWAKKTEIAVKRFARWLGIQPAKFFDWQARYGKANEHNGLVPRDHWLEEDERRAILEYHGKFPLEGYRRLTFMMLDADVVAASPATVYRVLKKAGLLDRWNGKRSKKGTGFHQPTRLHEHWHIDIAYLNVAGTFYYLCLVLDGFSRKVVHWDVREAMTEQDIECILERAREKFPGAQPRIISDNGPQFISRDFKAYIRLTGMTHVRTSPYYPQSNGKLERLNKTIKVEAIRVRNPGSLDEARNVVEEFVGHYNSVRLHSAIGFITPDDKAAGRAEDIWRERDRKLEAAREQRRQRRLTSQPSSPKPPPANVAA